MIRFKFRNLIKFANNMFHRTYLKLCFSILIFFIIESCVTRKSIIHNQSYNEIKLSYFFMGDDFENIFQINNNKVFVFRKYWNLSIDSTEQIGCIGLRNDENIKINNCINNIINLNDDYSNKQVLDGIEWKIHINYNGKEKSIEIFNSCVPQVDSLFVIINSILEKKTRKIPLTCEYSY